ncbi:hypothetical protein P167DRAFT_565003 [Morchella conica CCBAS932]|uniref:Uncharacterized protein n=1 Tax=Morchella conica CCBAS932 TaxID=1392247 RepID=A0A3N4KQV5_9PEZI|nr:hypothetical protein P167DRAFT_565003 [Morchella conica CCBAS932]
MSNQPTTLKDLSPELLIQISQNLPSFTSLTSLLSALPHTNRETITHYQFDICEAIAATELTHSLTPHFHALLKAQGNMQRLLSNTPPPPSLTPAAMRTTGILSGGARIGIDEAIQLESYLRQLRIWKPVFLEETRRMPRGCGNMFSDLLGRWNTLVFLEDDPEFDSGSGDSGSDSDGIFALVDLTLEWQLSGLSRARHVRIDRAWLNYWTMLFSRVGDERAHAAFVAAVAAGGAEEGEYALWTRGWVKGVEECPEGVRYLAPMWEWLKFVPQLCEPVAAAGKEMWDVVMVGGFEYVCGDEVIGEEEVLPVPVVGGAHMPPGVWGVENRFVGERVGEEIIACFVL